MPTGVHCPRPKMTKNDPLGDQNSECSFSHGASAGDLRPYWQIVTFRYGPKLRFWGSSFENHSIFEYRNFGADRNSKDFDLWIS